MGASDPGEALAGTFVEPRGTIRSIVAGTAGREVLGAVGAAAGSVAASRGSEDTSPLARGRLAYLTVSAHEVTMFRAKRGAFRPKATTEVIATALREEVRSAVLEKGRVASVLEITFGDGRSWAFDVPKVHLAGARAIAAALNS